MKNSVISRQFIHNGKPVEKGPSCYMTSFSTGTMRFRWNETNERRNDFFREMFGNEKDICPVELIHSKTVYAIEKSSDTFQKKGDGIITQNLKIVPVVTVADCMPIYVYDTKSKAFGVLHSGWKGTGILIEALNMAKEKYGTAPEDFCIVLGPSIHSCCYSITRERAEYFMENFGEDSVEKKDDDTYMLSLQNANKNIALREGIPEGNIFISDKCTSCHQKDGKFLFGSFRRETSMLGSDMTLEEKSRLFTVQAAFISWQ